MKFRPHFSVRTLAIFVTLVCAYLGAWEATKKWGVNNDLDFDAPYFTADKHAEFTGLRINTFDLPRDEHSPVALIVSCDQPPIRTYYLWLFGPRFMLPFKSKLPPRIIEITPAGSVQLSTSNPDR